MREPPTLLLPAPPQLSQVTKGPLGGVNLQVAPTLRRGGARPSESPFLVLALAASPALSSFGFARSISLFSEVLGLGSGRRDIFGEKEERNNSVLMGWECRRP